MSVVFTLKSAINALKKDATEKKRNKHSGIQKAQMQPLFSAVIPVFRSGTN